MALKLVINKVLATSDKEFANITVISEQQTSELTLTNEEEKGQLYKFSLLKAEYQKKMYQPTAITSTIMITASNASWVSIPKATLETLFKNKQVELYDVTVNEGSVSENGTVGTDFYVQDVKLCYKSKSVIATLKIFSLDKLMTLEKASRMFVSKKLGGDILKSEKQNDGSWKGLLPDLPYDSGKKMTCDTTQMKVLSYKKTFNVLKPKKKATDADEYEDREVTTEHIFPYLVQYNESLYDMLVRTCNRWGEFMYYENGKLNVGYSGTGKAIITHSVKNPGTDIFKDITYVNLGEKDLGAGYDCIANTDSNMSDNKLSKDPFDLGITADNTVMSEISAFFKNDKNIPTHIGNRLFDNAYNIATSAISMAYKNNKFDDKYFTDDLRNATVEKFNGNHSSYDSCNLFTEFKSDSDKFDYSNSKYGTILAKEIRAAKDSVCIDFDTNYPGLKLGQVIEVYSKEYIVVQIDCKPLYPQILKNKLYVVDNNENPVLVYQVIATAKDADETFYPTILPSGHIRYSDPQMAMVADSKDPSDSGRVRVLFSWQIETSNLYKNTIEKKTKEKENLEKAENDEKDEIKKATLEYQIKALETEIKGLEGKYTEWKDQAASPWLQFTANAGGKKGLMGKHYEDDTVFVGFVGGNVERPYVLGAISKGAGSDIQCTTPGGHVLKLKDDPSGISKFITGMLLPGWGTLSDFVPQMGELPETKGETGIKLGGGFELSDNYGIYKISGSTDKREVNVASPWGEVKINAFTGITISAPNGDVAIKGKNIKIEAGNNLEIVSGTNIKNKIMGGDGTGFFADITVAVTKKLAEKALNAINLSIIRSMMEIIFRPAEGQLRIKSNRFLMLDAGKGDCVYPQNAYSSADEYNDYIKEQSKKYSKDGLRLSSGVVEMISRVKTLSNLVDERYRTAYNNCINKLKGFNDAVSAAKVLAKEFATKPDEAICKTYAELKADMWADPNTAPNFDDTKIGFKANYSTTDKASVKQAMAINYGQTVKMYPPTKMPAEAVLKQDVLDGRKVYVANIVKAANELRQAIIDFLKFTELEEKDIKALTHAFKDRKMPKAFMESLANAFKKSNLGDTYYYQSMTHASKTGLDDLGAELAAAATKAHKLVLMRKAAILVLEGMGFKDDWREKIDDPTWVAPVPAVPGATAPKVLKVPRKFDEADLGDAYWNQYVASLITVPVLKPDEWKVTKELGKMANAAKDNLKNALFWKIASENEAWNNDNNGTILFSNNAKVYNLKDTTIDVVPSPPRENLTASDDVAGDVTTFLDNLKDALNFN